MVKDVFYNANNRNFESRKRLVNYGYKNLYSTKTKRAKSERSRQAALKRAIADGYPNLAKYLTSIEKLQRCWPRIHHPRANILRDDAAWVRRFLASEARKGKSSRRTRAKA